MNFRTGKSFRLFWSAAVALTLALGLFLPFPVLAHEAVYFLFRHAEKSTEGADPGLTEHGKERARAIGSHLQRAGVTRIFSSDYNRTRETVEPLSKATGIEIEFYDPRDLEGFARQLMGMSGTIAVSGHSNTTPELATLISGKTTELMTETDYGKLYVVVRKPGGETTVEVTDTD